LDDSDYGRQGHQKQLVKAIINKPPQRLSSPIRGKLLALQGATRDLLTLAREFLTDHSHGIATDK
jgi:hypothetical protein